MIHLGQDLNDGGGGRRGCGCGAGGGCGDEKKRGEIIEEKRREYMRREDNQRREEKRTEAKRSDPKRKEERREKRIASRLPCPTLPTCGLMPSASEGHRRVLFAKLLACAVHSLTRPRIISNIIMYWIRLTPG